MRVGVLMVVFAFLGLFATVLTDGCTPNAEARRPSMAEQEANCDRVCGIDKWQWWCDGFVRPRCVCTDER